MTPRILLISENRQHNPIYERAIRGFGAEVVVADEVINSVKKRRLLHDPFHGVMIDLHTALRSDHNGRAFLRDIEATYPVAKIRREGSNVVGFSSYGKGGLDAFMSYCQEVKPRRFRLQKRISYQARAMVSRYEDGLCPLPSLVLDISEGGIFVFSASQFDDGERLWVSIPSLGDDILIPIEVRWVVSWDTASRVPGFGARFLSLTDVQREEVRRIVGLNRS